MDNKISEQKKANRLLYMVIVGILCVTAIIIGLTAALGRRGHNQVPGTSGPTPSKPGTTAPVTTPSTTPPEDQTPTDGKLVLLAPLTGTVAKKHSDDMMVYSMTMNDYRIHQGVDIATAAGSAVYASAAGTVEKVWEDPMMGVCVTINHGGGVQTVYKNLSKTLADGVKEGAKIASAALIGTVGDTAMLELADEAHLHFEVIMNEVQVDPLTVLSPDSVATSLSGNDNVKDD